MVEMGSGNVQREAVGKQISELDKKERANMGM